MTINFKEIQIIFFSGNHETTKEKEVLYGAIIGDHVIELNGCYGNCGYWENSINEIHEYCSSTMQNWYSLPNWVPENNEQMARLLLETYPIYDGRFGEGTHTNTVDWTNAIQSIWAYYEPTWNEQYDEFDILEDELRAA